jgi:hypothetical protein
MANSEIDQGILLNYYNPCVGQPEIDKHCTCPAVACKVHGLCCACIAWHRDNGFKPLPHCLRDIEEVTWRERTELPPHSLLRSS